MLSFVEVKPDFVFSQYEISIIKSIWRSLDLNNPLNLKDFYYTVSAAINSTGTVTTNGVVSPKRDKFTSLIITQQDIANTISDYQVEEFIEVATSLIHHLEFGKEFPENELVQLLKRNQRIYKIYYKQYLTLGNSLMEAIEDFTNLLVGKSKRIFSRFLSILLSAILYYSNDISFVDTTTTNSNNTLNINLTATPTTTHSNASIYSELSYSMLSLNTDNTSTSAATTAEAIILEEIIKPPQLIEIQPSLPSDIDEQSQPVQSTPEDVEYAEDATITNSIYTNNTVDNGDANSGFFDSSYDYLNSFAISPDNDDDDDDEYDNGQSLHEREIVGKKQQKNKFKVVYKEEEDDDDFDDTKSIVSTMSNLSSFKKWGIIRRKKSHKDKFRSSKKFIHKNILRSEK